MCGFGFWDVFWILGRVLDLEVFLDSGTCFVPTSHRTLATLSLYFCCENFGLFSKTRSAAWLDCLYSRHWRQVFHQFTLDGAENTGLVTTHNFHRSETVNKKNKSSQCLPSKKSCQLVLPTGKLIALYAPL